VTFYKIVSSLLNRRVLKYQRNPPPRLICNKAGTIVIFPLTFNLKSYFTLAYNDTEMITAVKSFMIQLQHAVQCHKTFWVKCKLLHNKPTRLTERNFPI
jgi:hypothetical protein